MAAAHPIIHPVNNNNAQPVNLEAQRVSLVTALQAMRADESRLVATYIAYALEHAGWLPDCQTGPQQTCNQCPPCRLRAALGFAINPGPGANANLFPDHIQAVISQLITQQ